MSMPSEPGSCTVGKDVQMSPEGVGVWSSSSSNQLVVHLPEGVAKDHGEDEYSDEAFSSTR